MPIDGVRVWVAVIDRIAVAPRVPILRSRARIPNLRADAEDVHVVHLHQHVSRQQRAPAPLGSPAGHQHPHLRGSSSSLNQPPMLASRLAA